MDALTDKIRRREARCGVIGLGYVGLPLALEFARAGFDVTGIDLDERKIDAINAGRSYIVDTKDNEIREQVERRRFRATNDFSVIRDLDTINICVPTPLRKTKDPDLTYVVSAVNEIKQHLRRGQLVILESTTYPGTTDEVVRPALESGGLVAGKDFALAFSPERIDPGTARYNTKNIPKVVGGHSPACTAVASALYEQSVDTVIQVSSTQVAEMVKLLENTFRSVNIGLVNEIAMMCGSLGINVWEVIDAAKTKPFGFMPF
jgi:UDP-N-acetyl-D-glucosamine dehydrogenase